MKKRIASLFLALMMIVTLGNGAMAATTTQQLVTGNTTGLSAANFKDLADATKADGRHWAWDSIDHVVKAGLFNGTSPTTFAPQNPMTRAQFVVVVTRLENTTRTAKNKLNVERVPTKTRFTDVPEDMWCAGAVAWAEANGIVEGYSDNTFRPNQAISRAQISAFVYRYCNNYKKYTLKTLSPEPEQFTDFALASTVFHTAINYCRIHDLVRGYGDHTLRPNISVTRAQVATILSRIILIIQKSSGGGGGGGGGGYVAPVVTSYNFTAGGAFDWATGNYTVKFVAVDENDDPVDALTNNATADLYGNEVPAANATAYTLHSDNLANASQAAGFKLEIKQIPTDAYKLSGVKVYKDNVSAATVKDEADEYKLTANTNYTYTAETGSVTMNTTQFGQNNRITVVAQYKAVDSATNTAKTTPTLFKFLAQDSTGAVKDDLGKAALLDWNIAKNETTKRSNNALVSSGDGVEQGKDADGVLVGAKVSITAASGYEISDPGKDITVYGVKANATDKKKLTSGTDYTLSGYEVNMTPAQLGTTNEDMYKEVIVEAKFTKSEYGYQIKFNLPIMSGVGFDLDTYNSYEKASTLIGGGSSIKDALALLIDDAPIGSAPLNSDKKDADSSNAGKFSGNINAGMSAKIVDKLTDGMNMPMEDAGRLKATVESMATSTGASILNKDLTDGKYDDKILGQVSGTINTALSSFYDQLFNGYKESINKNANLVTASKFVDGSGNEISSAKWTNAVNADTFVFTGKLTAANLSLADADNMTTNVKLKRKNATTLEVKPEFENVKIKLDSVSGDYTITIKDAGVLYVPMTTGTRQQVQKYSGTDDKGNSIVYDPSGTGTLTLRGSITEQAVSGVEAVDVAAQLKNTSLPAGMMKGIIEQILDETVQGKIDSMKSNLQSAVKAAGASDKVLESLNRNLLNRLNMSNFLSVDDNGNIVFKFNAFSKTDSGEDYREQVLKIYNGFWDFNAELYAAYPNDAAMRSKILYEVLDWMRGKVISSDAGKGQLQKMADALTEKQVPTVESFYNALATNTSDTQVVKDKTRAVSTKSGLQGMLFGMLGMGGDTVNIHVTFSMFKTHL